MQKMTSITILVFAVLASLLLVFCYASTVHELVSGGLDTDGGGLVKDCFALRDEIDVVVWVPLPVTGGWPHSGASLLRYPDPPEGTKAIIYFPSWYLLIPLAGFIACSVIDLSRRSRKGAGS